MSVLDLKDRVYELLVAYAAGRLPPATALLVATHLAIVPENRSFIAAAEAFGGALVEDGAPIHLADPQGMLNRIFSDAPSEPDPVPAEAPPGRLPAPLRNFLNMDMDDIPWRTLTQGLKSYPIMGHDGHSLKKQMSLYLIKADHAASAHTHGGTEITLVLEGGYNDITGRYDRGDLAIADESVDHQPFADADEDCICLAIVNGPLRLTGTVGKVVQPFQTI